MTRALLDDPHTAYAAMRAAGPAHQVTLPDGSPVWVLTRYSDVRAGLADPRLSLNKRTGTGDWGGFKLPPALDANLLNMDAPDHTRIRRLVAPAFSARRVEALRPRVAALAAALLARRPADLISGYAVPLAVTVICDLLGVPDADRPHLRTWTAGMLGGSAEAVAAFETYLRDLIAAKRSEPADDLITAMVAARDEDDRLSEDELTSLAFLTLLAGYENSVNLIGNCILLLLQRPELVAAVRSDERLRRAAVEETLRYEPPAILALRRFAREDLAYGEVTIPAGATVLLSLAAANRDPAAVDNPDEFRLRVPAAPHVGLGYGPHYCLGAALAQLSAEEATGTLLERFPQVALAAPAAPPAWRRSIRSRALTELPVILTP